MIDLFNMELDSTEDEFEELNELLATSNANYLKSFGRVGSLEWWRSVNSGEQKTLVVEGRVLSLRQEMSEEKEDLDIAEVETDKALLDVTLTYYKEDHGVEVGDKLRMETIVVYTDENSLESGWNLDLKLSKTSA